MTIKYLIIGGGLAGHNAAAAIREKDTEGSILIVGAEPRKPYHRPPLTKEFMQGKDPLEKAYCSPEEFYTEKSIHLALGTVATKLDASAKTVQLSDGSNVHYDKLLLATGGSPIRPDAPGMDLPNVHLFRTMDDAAAVSAKATAGKRVVIVGGGFIGIELAASLTQRDVRATVIDGGPHIWSRFADQQLGGFFQSYCGQRGVIFLTSEKLVRIEGDSDGAKAVVTASGRSVPCDVVVVAIGIVPNVELAQQAGLQVDNGIVCNEYLQSSDASIYAAGDNCSFLDPYAQRRRRVEHWGQADYCGTLAGKNMAGGREAYDLLPYVFSDVFDLHLEFSGDEHQADRKLLRGEMSNKGFSVLYLKDNRLMAHFTVNLKRKQYGPLNKLIEKKVDLAGKEAQLQDAGFDLNAFLPQEQSTKV